MFLTNDEIKQRIVAIVQQFDGELSEEGLLRYYNEHVADSADETLCNEEFQDFIVALYIDNKITWNKEGSLKIVSDIFSI